MIWCEWSSCGQVAHTASSVAQFTYEQETVGELQTEWPYSRYTSKSVSNPRQDGKPINLVLRSCARNAKIHTVANCGPADVRSAAPTNGDR